MLAEASGNVESAEKAAKTARAFGVLERLQVRQRGSRAQGRMSATWGEKTKIVQGWPKLRDLAEQFD